ncbi:signal peptidase II [Shewanella sp. KT0246]|uniref:signal peptidase II n=1 Tax=Shewanella sp. KT0246 TaxID=2815912 RepID=UPI001C7D6C9C|nr:signal peptidase II [Shewanella sp. KT0246]
MNIWKRLLTILLVTLSCVGCDQGSKALAVQHLPRNESYSFFFDIFRVSYAENIGAFLGMGEQFSEHTRFIIFVVIIGLFLLGLLLYLIINTQQQLPSVIALSLVFSGGLSNFYDRMYNNGAVIDFLNLGLGSFRTGIFNIADMAILLGAIMLVFSQSNRTQRKRVL